MLLSIREKTNSIIVKVIVGLFILFFAFFGLVDYNQLGQADQDAIAKVGDFTIPRNEFEIVYRQYMQRFQAMFNHQIPVDAFRQDMINESVRGLVTQKLFQNFLADLKFDVAEPVVKQAIATNPGFVDEQGVFQPERFKAVLARLNLSEEQYVELLKHDIIANNIREIILSGYELPDFYLKRLYNYEFEQRAITLATIPLTAFQKDVPDEASLQKFYNENISLFQTPEYRSLQYIHLDPAELAKPIIVSEEDARANYQQFIERYSTPEQRHIQQILASTPELADKALAATKQGIPFEKIAETLADAAVSYSDLGLVTKDRLLRDIAETAFTLDAGAISPVLQSSLGFHIVKITKVDPEKVTAFDDVREEITARIRDERAYTILAEQLTRIEELLASNADLPSIAAQLGITLKTVPAFDAAGRTPDGHEVDVVKGQPDLIRAIFQQLPNTPSAPLDLQEDGIVVYQVSGVEPPTAKPFESVREQVIAAAQLSSAESLARDKAKAVVEKMNQGLSMADALKDLPESVVQDYKAIRRDGTTLDGSTTGLNSFILDRTFTLPLNNAMFHLADNTVNLVLVKKIAPPEKVDDEQKTTLKNDMNAQLQQDMAEQFSEYLKRRYKVEIFADKLQNMFPEPVTVPEL